MISKRMALFFIICALFFSGSARAESRIDFLEGSEKHVSIDLRDSDIVDVLKFLAQKGNFNIFLSKGIQGKVSLYLQDVRISDILDIVLLSNGLAQSHTGSIVYVMTQEEYKSRYGEDYSDAREIKWLHLKYASPAQVFKILEPTKSKVGSIVVDEQSGTIILVETPEKMKFMLDLITELDRPLETKIIDLSYSKAADVQALLSAQITTVGVASIHADVRSNQIIITALPSHMKEIEKMVQTIDRKTREVAIDTQIVKIVLSNAYKQGIDWQYMFQSGVLEPLSLKTALPTSLSSLGSVQYSALSSKGVEILYQFLRTLGESKILASPRITVVEGEEAKILIGTREAYVTSTTTTGTSTSTISEAISFIDVGISLGVSALINKDGYVTMKIKPEVSSVVRTLITPSKSEIPIVDTTQAETRVMVKDGTTIVIGGLRKDEKTRSSNRVPGLSNLPAIGNLFRHEDNKVEQTELVVFLTPHIIEGNQSVVAEQNRAPKGFQSYGAAMAPVSGGAPAPNFSQDRGGNKSL